MNDIIQLLPDSVANQIAAGEVIQRPASVIKELVENSIDAGATLINVVCVNSGRTSIQVTDNGKGMSETDARLSFERHATSKIRQADDLFNLHTMGFRGEALASIAAVAQVELRTRRPDDDLGTALDFAFQIHTFLGSHCIGAKVNHKLVPLSHKLQSGDQVEILSSKSQHVQASWINFVFTAKAKQKIMAILRRDNRELQKRGEQILDDWLRKNELEMTTQVLNKLCELHEAKKHEDLFLMLGKRSVLLGDKDLDELRERKAEQGGWRKFVPFLKKDNSKDDKKSNLFIVGEGFNKKKPVIINEENISQYIFPTCCHAIPGDDIMGYIDNKNRIEIHRRNCDVASRLKASFGNRILDAKWDMHKVMFFDATIELRGIDRKGMLHDISEVISDKLDVNMHRITISSEEGIFDGTIEIRVHDRSEVSVIMDELKKIEDLKEVLQIL